MLGGVKFSSELNLICPPVMCCNCGKKTQDIEVVETPLTYVRNYLITGAEYNLETLLPYCPQCTKSAMRIRKNWMAKLLCACMMVAALFMLFVVIPDSLPAFMQKDLFYSAIGSGFVLTFLYFFWREKLSGQKSYYQPVSVYKIKGHLKHITLNFHNEEYAKVFAQANKDLLNSPNFSMVVGK